MATKKENSYNEVQFDANGAKALYAALNASMTKLKPTKKSTTNKTTKKKSGK